MNADCSYIEYRTGKKKPRHRFHEPCFVECKFKGLDKLEYYAAIEGGLTLEQVEWWISFLRLWLNDLEWDAKPVASEEGKPYDYVLYTLKTFSPSRKHNLLYCTAFRYIDEYSDVVKALFKLAKEGADFATLFETMQVIHWDMIFRTGRYADLKGHDIKDHSLIHYSGGSSIAPITIDQFRKNLADNVPGVQLHFCSDPEGEMAAAAQRVLDAMNTDEMMAWAD